ncbi:MAG: hypothetical protein ILA39_02670 [Bacteroidaceae bacterium]|nr:hypothetical protein [Bacteroidaceae bacterium]
MAKMKYYAKEKSMSATISVPFRVNDIQTRQLNIEAMTVFLSVVQESQELLSALRHLMRGENKIEE